MNDDHLVRGAGAAKADAATQGRTTAEDCDPNTPPARPAEPIAPGEKPDQLNEKDRLAEDHQEALVDEGVEETFPASDPVSAKRIT